MSTPAEILKIEEEEKIEVLVEKERVEILDDTPLEDQGKTPMPDEIVREVEEDELDEYSDKVKTRLKQMKKIYHDERRLKEEVTRQQEESIALNKHLIQENQKLKHEYASGEKTLVETYESAANLELANAKRQYKEAYDSGDSDAVVEAQQALNTVNHKLQRVADYKPTLQDVESGVYSEVGTKAIEPDAKTQAWQKRNEWYGGQSLDDLEMTALALGLHQRLEREHGRQYVGTDNYWHSVDTMMKRRFPEKFEGEGGTSIKLTDYESGKLADKSDTRPASIVAPASRSTGSKRIVLKKSQIDLAKKIGVTPEQYARELAKLENV